MVGIHENAEARSRVVRRSCAPVMALRRVANWSIGVSQRIVEVMLRITIENKQQQAQYRHEAGRLILGRCPNSEHQIQISDQYVSRRHLAVEQIATDQIRCENLGRNPVHLPNDQLLEHGDTEDLTLPTQLRLGKTVLRFARDQATLSTSTPRPIDPEECKFRTIALPAVNRSQAGPRASLDQLGHAPSAEELALWFETLLTVQRSVVGSPQFYQETARAIVELIGLDRGLVLLRDGQVWQVAAGYAVHGDHDLEYSSSILQLVLEQQRTFFGNPQSLSSGASLNNLEAVVASPIIGQREGVIGILYGSRDFTTANRSGEVTPLEAQLVQLLASSVSTGLMRLEIERRLKRAEQFAAVGQALGYIIHDLRGPLGNVQQLLEMSVEDGEAAGLPDFNEAQRRKLVDQSLAIAMDLLNDSLEFCRGNVHVEPVRGSFNQLMATHFRLLRMDLDTMGSELRIETDDDFQVYLDPDRMARVFRNLAKNAAEAMRGQVDAVVTIGGREVKHGVELFVADNGPGLPAEIRDKMFQAFATHGKRGGTGFGLAIAKQLVEAHAGEIDVATSAAGTRFVISLPDDEDATVSTETTRLGLSPSDIGDGSARAESSSRQVLLVEDSLVNQRLVSNLLGNAGHVVTIAADGQQALAALQAKPFDIVLMDVEMPNMDGLEATRIVRRRERRSGRRVPIVALTAHSLPETHQECLDAGTDAVLIKPVRTDELQRVLEELC